MANVLLKQARIARKWTQRNLAEKLDVEIQTVRSWERGTRFPSQESRTRLCAIFGMTPEQLGLGPVQSIDPLSLEQAPHNGVIASVVTPETAVSFPVSNRADLNRQRMLQRVRATWIDGVLEHSLHQADLIVLNLQEQPDALANPWQMGVQETNLPRRSLPPGTSINQVYDDTFGGLLLLGAPGAGKTTLLLELTRILLDRAKKDPGHLIPVVFPLSSWASKQLSMTDWMIEELYGKYRVPRSIGQQWVGTGQILPLLDGLDEVAEVARPACVKAINVYIQKQELISLVVCCRQAEYFAQATRVTLQRAVFVGPLTKKQIDDSLSRAGNSLAAMRTALEEDPGLQEMVEIPLMLSIVTLAYQEEDSAIFATTGSIETRRKALFAIYVQRMLTRRGADNHYTVQQTVHWLSWLAQQLVLHSQTEFFVEQMQPDWLPAGRSRHRYQSTVLRLIYGIESMVVAGLFAWLRGGKVSNGVGVGAGLLGWLGGGVGNRVLEWMAPGLGGGIEGGGSLGIILGIIFPLVTLLVSASALPVLSPGAVWYGLSNGLRNGLKTVGIAGLVGVLLFGIRGGISHGLAYGLGTGLFTGLDVGLLNGLISGLQYEQALAQGSSSEREQRRPLADRLVDGLLIGLSAGVCFGIIDGLLHLGLSSIVTYGFIAGLCGCIAFSIGGGTTLIRGLGREIKPAETVMWSWSHVRQDLFDNLKKGFLVGLAVLMTVSVLIGCMSGFFYGVSYGLRYGLVYGLIIGSVAGAAGILTASLHSGWSSDVLADRQQFRPNEGIVRSAHNSLFAACLFGVVGGVASGLISGLAFGLVAGLSHWLILGIGFAIIFGVIFALEFGTIYGGIACLEHYILRWCLWRAGYLPLRYVSFLDRAAERVLLRRVGGGYIFVHRLLLEYFASLQVLPDGDTSLPLLPKVP